MTRTKKKVFSKVTLDQAQAASYTYATNCTTLSKLEAKMNEEINKVKSKYQDQITELTESLEEPTEILNVFANEQKDNWGKKSLELLHCIIGFRTGTRKVEKDKKFTWDAVLQLMKASKVFKPFIRVKEEINKDAILAEKNAALIKKLEGQCFIKIVQDETFFVETKKEEAVPA